MYLPPYLHSRFAVKALNFGLNLKNHSVTHSEIPVRSLSPLEVAGLALLLRSDLDSAIQTVVFLLLTGLLQPLFSHFYIW